MFSQHSLSIRLVVIGMILAGLALAGSRVLSSQGSEPRPAPRDDRRESRRDPSALSQMIPDSPDPAPTPTSPASGYLPLPGALVSGGFMAIDGWSPESQWLAYWYTPTHSRAASRNDWPASELQFFNPANGQLCTHPEVIAADPDPGTWTKEGKFLVATVDRYLSGEPCEDFHSITLEQYAARLPLPLYDPALSTRGTYQAATTLLGRREGSWRYATVFTEIESGEEVLSLEWETEAALADRELGGMWRNNWQFLVHQTLERGPLLVSLANPREVVEVVPELFGLAPEVTPGFDDYSGWVAYSTPFYGHFLLQRPANGAQTPEILFYHRVKNQVETLPFTQIYGTGFYPPGRSGTKPWLMMAVEDLSTGNGEQSYYYRELDALGGEFTLLGSSTPRLAWLREIYYVSGNRLALGWEDGRVRVQTFPGERAVGEFSTGQYRAGHLEWSAGGKYLAVLGSVRVPLPGSSALMGLYIFEVPQQ